MFRKYVIPVIAVAGLILAVFVVMQGSKAVPAAAPVTQPAAAPYASYVAGAGIVESSTENINIGTGVGGTVTNVYVKIGDRVKVGDPLFLIRDKTLRAELKMQQAAVETAKARISDAKATLGTAKSQLEMYESVPDKRAIIEEELIRRRHGAEGAAARLEQANAEFEVAKAQVEVTAADLDRHTIKSTIDGTVLQVKIQPRRIRDGRRAADTSHGHRQHRHPRRPRRRRRKRRMADRSRLAGDCVRPRQQESLYKSKNLPASNRTLCPSDRSLAKAPERVDTRVLQVLYSFQRGSLPVYVGQQMDVFIQAPSIESATHSSSAPSTREGVN